MQDSFLSKYRKEFSVKREAYNGELSIRVLTGEIKKKEK